MPMEKNDFRFPDEAPPSEDETQINPLNSATDDEIEVEVVDDTPEEDRGRVPMAEPPRDVTDEELQKYDESVRTRIKKFSKGYHDERRRAEAAEREREAAIQAAAALTARNKELEQNLTKSQEALLVQAKRVVESELEKARTAFKQAHDSGDAEAVLKAQEALNHAQMRADKVNSFKPPVAKPATNGVQPAPQVTSAPPPAPVRDEKALAWQQKNQWFGQDRRMTAYAFAVHSDLVDGGVDPTSDEYYRKVDGEMRKRFPDAFKGSGNAAGAEPPARTSSVVAPATRTSAASQKITLTKSQVDMARRLNVPLKQYAMQVLALNRKS